MPLYDTETGKFTRGEHPGASMEEVAEDHPGYLVFLVAKANTDQATLYAVEEFIMEFPDLFEGLLE